MSDRRWHLLVLLGCLLLYVPAAASHGLWDPWESHYAEVSRQMATRGDYVELWWPGSPIDTEQFDSKPVLIFWIEALAFRALGLASANAPAGEMATSSAAEWACRLPVALFATLGVWAVFWATSRLLSRRAGLFAAAVVATAPLYALLAHQATPDIPFVATMTAALACLAVALEGDARAVTWRSGVFVALVGVLGVLVVVPVAHFATRIGVASVAPYPLLAAWLAVRLARARDESVVLGTFAGVFAGLAVLAKGLAGVGIPGLVLVAYAVVAWRAPWKRIDLVAAALAWVLVALPWYHAIIALTGGAYFEQYIVFHHFERAASGVHGETGPFTYFLRELGYGLWVWIPLAVAAVCAAVARRERAGLVTWAVVWAFVTFAVLTASQTKFHHYCLPVVPPVAILCGWYLDTQRPSRLVMGGIGLPLLALVVLDLTRTSQSAERILWLFDYDYMLGGLPWPGEDFRPWLWAIAGAGALATVAMMWTRVARRAAIALVVVGVAGAAFLLDGFLPRLGPHWTEKELLATYYRERAADEPLAAFRVYFRGETFYSQNELYDPALAPRRRTAFVGRTVEAPFVRWLERHRGQRVFVLARRMDLRALRALVDARGAKDFRIVDDHHNKIVLTTVRP